jgi:hypothetical protein
MIWAYEGRQEPDRCPMLERTSRLILEVFPYVSAALIAAVIVPGYLYSQAHGFRAVATPTFPAGNENALEIIHRDHAVFAPTKVVGRDLNVRKFAPH